MLIKNELNKIKLPDIYKREGKDCYYDTYRKKLIEIIPEETVRQKVAKYFELKLGVPREMISLEVPMSHYLKGKSGRADIVIYANDKHTKQKCPMAVIECKKEDISLTDNVAEQALRYCKILKGKYIVITNGIEIKAAVYNEKTEDYNYIDGLLSYKEMIAGDYVIPNLKVKKFKRFSMFKLNNQRSISKYNESEGWFFGADTEPVKRTFAVNLYQALLDSEHKLPVKKFKTFELIKDLGQRYMSYGNAGGGFFEGTYRSFLVNDRFRETQIVSLSVFGTSSDFRGEKRGSYTSLIVSIEGFKTSHNSLEYKVDTYAQVRPKGIMEFIHNGRISNIKNEYVIDKVREQGDCLTVSENTIDIGELHINKLLYLDDDEVSEFIYSLIEYALLREEVRNDFRKK